MICPSCQYEHDNEGDRYGCPNCEGLGTAKQYKKGYQMNAAKLDNSDIPSALITTGEQHE